MVKLWWYKGAWQYWNIKQGLNSVGWGWRSTWDRIVVRRVDLTVRADDAVYLWPHVQRPKSMTSKSSCLVFLDFWFCLVHIFISPLNPPCGIPQCHHNIMWLMKHRGRETFKQQQSLLSIGPWHSSAPILCLAQLLMISCETSFTLSFCSWPRSAICFFMFVSLPRAWVTK